MQLRIAMRMSYVNPTEAQRIAQEAVEAVSYTHLIKLSGSFYYANTYNQTFDPRLPVSSGYDKLYVQTGYVRNYGFEAMSVSYTHLLKGADFEKKLVWKTNEGFKVKPFYRMEDLEGLKTTDAPVSYTHLDKGTLREAHQ